MGHFSSSSPCPPQKMLHEEHGEVAYRRLLVGPHQRLNHGEHGGHGGRQGETGKNQANSMHLERWSFLRFVNGAFLKLFPVPPAEDVARGARRSGVQETARRTPPAIEPRGTRGTRGKTRRDREKPGEFN